MKARRLSFLLPALAQGCSRMPFWCLYGLSDLLAFWLSVLGYRKKVIGDNLRRSFPEKPEAELRRLRRRFYRHLCDVLLESLKLLSLSPKEIDRRVQFDPALYQGYAEEKRSVIVVLGHFGNWEWAGARLATARAAQALTHRSHAVYYPPANPTFDKLLIRLRTRFGNGVYAMRHTARGMAKNRRQLTLTTFVADQSPAPESAYWTRFLHQDTAVHQGAEKLARHYNYPLVYGAISRVRRGYYRIHSETLCAEPQKTAPGELSEAYTRRLEADIRAQPEQWLWSHRRWKHRRPEKPSKD